MINGDVDLTTNLDFYRDKSDKKKSNNKLLPWNKRRKDDNLSSSNLITVNSRNLYEVVSNITSTATYYSTMSNDGIYYWTTLSDNNYHSNTIDFNPNIVYYNNSTSTIGYSTTFNSVVQWIDHNTGIINNDYIDIDNGNIEIVEEKSSSIFKSKIPKQYKSLLKYNYCCDTYKIGKCKKCRKDTSYYKYTNSSKSFKELCENKDRKISDHKYYIDDISYTNINLIVRDNKKHIRFRGLKHNRRIPWLRKLDSRIYEDYITDLFEEQDYSDYLTNMNWLRISR